MNKYNFNNKKKFQFQGMNDKKHQKKKTIIIVTNFKKFRNFC